MSNYVGFFVRDQLGQVPDQIGSAWSSCPDIIFAGAVPPKDPSVYTTAAGYAIDYGSNIYASTPATPNFVYLRALNTNTAATTAAPITGRAWFFWVESDLALWPQNWNYTLVTVAAQQINYQDIVTTGVNQVVMCNLPFIWEPPQPAANTHYCGVYWIENVPVNPPTNPVLSLGSLGSFNDLVNLVLSNPNMGWRNTTDVGGMGFTWTQTTNITGPKEAPGTFYLGIQCTNMPADAQLGYQVPGPTPQIPTIISNLSQITNPNMLNLVPITNWPAGAASSIILDYVQTTPPQPGAKVVVTLIIPNQSLSHDTLEMLAKAPEHLVIRTTAEFFDRDADFEALGEVGDIFGAVIGTQTFGF